MVTILSLSGGGIRGIIPAMVLEELERRTGRPVCTMFDYIAGTSTGGILACMLAVPNQHGQPRYSASRILECYLELGGAVFRRSLARRLRTLGGLTDARYSSRVLRQYLHEYLGNVRLSAALTRLVIPAYETRSASPYFFKSAFARPFGPDHENPPMKAAAMATAAAPTFFPPCQVGQNHCFVDGGLFANNPALCAYADARRAFPEEQDFLVVSLGTGIHLQPFTCRQLRRRGLIGWVSIILRMLQNSSTATVQYQMKTLIGPGYREFQIPLDRQSDDMDDASPKNLERLREAGQRLIQEKAGELAEVAQILMQHRRH